MRILISAALMALAFTVANPRTAEACACCGSYQVVNVAWNDVLNIRNGPSSRYAAIGALPPGESCVVITGQCYGNWCPVSHGRQSGWVNARYLRYISGAPQ